MSELIRVPNIGNDEGEVVELLVRPGDKVEADQSLLTLESDRASMGVPGSKARVVKSVEVKVGDALKEGDEVLELEVEGDGQSTEVKVEATPTRPEAPRAEAPTPAPSKSGLVAPATASIQDIKIPDIGSTGRVNVIEVMIRIGDTAEADRSLITPESDKASMEIPSPASGAVEDVSIKVDDEIDAGDLILKLKVEDAASTAEERPTAAPTQVAAPAAEQKPAAAAPAPVKTDTPTPVDAPSRDGTKAHAGPAVRMLTRELDAELSEVKVSGSKGRILREDVQAFVKEQLQRIKSGGVGATGGAGIPPIPEADFNKLGEVEEAAVTRLMQVGVANLHHSWLNVPHATQFDQSGITDMKAFCVIQKATAEETRIKLTVLPILFKICAHLLKKLSGFSSSLTPSSKALVRKKYVHTGFAVDTPDGLLASMIRDVNQKSLLQLAAEAAEPVDKAHNKKLSADAMQGACLTISSLGHIGDIGFASIVNTSKVAVLGVPKVAMQPVWDGKIFRPRLMLPLLLSYDHRVINGIAAARFTKCLDELLADICALLP